MLIKMQIGTNFRNVEFVHYYLRKFPNYKFIYASPVELAEKVLNKEIDIAPFSSVFYALHKDKFLVLPEFSISGKNRTGSVLLFSKKYDSLDKANNKKIDIGVPENSATSINLLKIILNLKNVKARFVRYEIKNLKESLEKNDFTLMIGDDAIFSNEKAVCDLGEEYYKLTNQGVVYALWMTNKDIDNQKKKEIKNFFYDLKISREYAYKNFDFVIKEILDDVKISINAKKALNKLKANISLLSYDLNDEKIIWLKNFFEYLKKFKIIEYVPELKFLEI